MIQSIEMKFFRGIREGRLEGLTPLTVLVGPNGSGKSTVLEALMIGAHPRPAEAVGQVGIRRPELNHAGRWLLWRGNAEESSILKTTTDTSENRSCTLRLIRSEETVEIECLVLWPPAPNRRTTISFDKEKPGRYFLEVDLSAPLQGTSEVRFVDTVSSPMEPSLDRLFTATYEAGRRDEVNRVLRELLPTLETMELLAPGGQPVLYLSYPDRSVPAALAGDGIRLLLRLAMELATRKQGLVLVEEPEVHMHPGAIWQAAQVVVAAMRQGVQIVLTTHSLELIDDLIGACTEEDLKKMSVLSVRLDGGRLISSQLTGPEVHLARSAIKDDLR